MFWGNRTPRERILAVVAIVLLVLGACGRASGEEVQATTCSTRDYLRSWSDGVDRLIKPDMTKVHVSAILGYQRQAREIEDQLTVLCAQEKAGPVDGNVQWLQGADRASQLLLRLGYDAATGSVLGLQNGGYPYTPITLDLVFNDKLNLLRATAYMRSQAKQIEYREVPAQCPQVQAAPPNPCAETLRTRARQWSETLRTWTSSRCLFVRGLYCDFADDSRPALWRLAESQEDPVSVIVGWLAQYRSVDRTNRQSGSSSGGYGPMPQIAADMRAQLGLCGIAQPDYDR